MGSVKTEGLHNLAGVIVGRQILRLGKPWRGKSTLNLSTNTQSPTIAQLSSIGSN
jgi:hypothetical protein